MSMLRMSGRLLLRWKRGPPPAAGPPDGDDEDEEEQDADADGVWLPAACPPIMARPPPQQEFLGRSPRFPPVALYFLRHRRVRVLARPREFHFFSPTISLSPPAVSVPEFLVVNGRDGHARTAVAGAKPHRIINYYVKPHLLITVHVSSTWHQYDS